MWWCILSLLLSTTLAQQPKQFDVIVYGSTPAGIAASISAANGGKYHVALIEPSANLGGMLTAGGIGLRDLGNTATFGGLGKTWAMMNARYYGVDYPVYQPDMDVGLVNVKALLTENPTIQVFTETPLYEGIGNVVKQGNQIVSIATGTDPKTIQEWQAKVFVDATYEGDLARFAKVSYTFGRESKSQYNEAYGGVQAKRTSWGNFLDSNPAVAAYDNGTYLPYISKNPLGLEGSADNKLQAYSYRLCITRNKENQSPFPKPPGYNPSDFILLQRYIDSLVQSRKYPNGPPFSFLVDVLPYRSYPHGDKYDLCDSQSAFTSDACDLNEGYVLGTRSQRKLIEGKHYYYVAGLLTYLSTNLSVPEYTRNSTLEYGLCKDQWVNNGNWPTQIYVREGLRIVGDKVITQNDLVSGQCTNDSIGVGSWGIDIHVVQRLAVLGSDGKTHIADNEGQMMTKTDGKGDVYELSYSLLLPKRTEAVNLLVPVCSSSSHVAFGSIRVEPTYIQLGQAAGVAASLAIQNNLSVQDVSIAEMQSILIKQGINIHWPTNNCS